jgi:bifunctional N-acetylglucosamine-1-phosphate-uridyltransferase/glucosamine-1-phosphate-acetyltransferase GlmU-like protein
MAHLHVIVVATDEPSHRTSHAPEAFLAASGRPLIDYSLRAVHGCAPGSVSVLTLDPGDDCRAHLATAFPDARLIVAASGGAAQALFDRRTAFATTDALLLISARAPLVTSATLQQLIEGQQRSRGVLSLGPAGEPGRACLALCAAASDVVPALDRLGRRGAGESLLADLLEELRRERHSLQIVVPGDPDEWRSVESPIDRVAVTDALRRRKTRALLDAGVLLNDPSTTYVDDDVSVGAGTIIDAAVHLEGSTSIGDRCRIHAGVRITNSTIASSVTVLDHSVIVESVIGDGARIGPFAHLRPQSNVGAHAHVGNFVELKKTSLGAGSKANHLAYLGDATIGTDTNIGAGTITCNYDGERKHPTIIGDRVFIGSDSQLVAPVCIGDGAYVAAGSSITKDVPAAPRAGARARPSNQDRWVSRRKENDS